MSAYRVTEDGQLVLLSRQATCGADACFVCLWPDERWLLAANYSGGSVAVFPVRADGALGAAACVLRHSGAGVNAARQEAPHPHQILLAPDGVHVYVPDLGLDRLVCYRFDAERGWLERDGWPDIPGVPGQGIRHGVFSADGLRLYVMTEMAAQVNVYAYDPASGRAERLQVCDTVDAAAGVLGAAIRLHPNGRTLYASVRGADVLVTFAVDADGWLVKTGMLSSGGAIPRDFVLTPDGRFLLAGNQDSDTVCVFAVDAQGALTRCAAADLPAGAVTVLHVTE